MNSCVDFVKSLKMKNIVFQEQFKVPYKLQVSYLPGFDLKTRDSHLTILIQVFTNHVFAENTYFTSHR